MIGLIVKKSTNPNLYHKIDNKSIIEHTIENAHLCSQAHRVFVVAPLKERRKLEEIIYKKYLGNKQTFTRFYNMGETDLDALYMVAQENGLDTIAVIDAAQPLLPAWIINNCIYEFENSGCRTGMANSSNKGFRVEIFSYSALAKFYSDRAEDDAQQAKFIFKETEEANTILQFGGLNLYWENPEEQHELFEHLIHGSKTYDLEDMIEEVINGNNQKNSEE